MHLLKLRLVAILLLGLLGADLVHADHKNYYKVLGVSKDASQRDIKASYKRLALKWHPDKNPNDEAAKDKFVELNEAYETLGDITKKAQYDADVEREKLGGGGGGMFSFWNNRGRSGSYSETMELSNQNWNHFLNSDTGDVWVILFYSDSSPNAKAMAPVWEDASRRLEGVVRFGRLNAEVERWITGQMRIRFVPQVLSTVAGSNSFKTLNGAITADTLISFASESFPNNIRTFNWESEFDSLVLNAKDTHKLKVIILQDTPSVQLKFKHLARKYKEVSTWFVATETRWRRQRITKPLEITSYPTFVIYEDAGINPTPIVISNFYESSVSELDTLLRDRTFNMRPILAKVSVDNYPEVCAWDSLCVIVPVRPNEIETLHRLRGSISVSVLQLLQNSLRKNFQFAWLDTSSPDAQYFTKAFGLSKDARNVAILFDRSRQRYETINLVDDLQWVSILSSARTTRKVITTIPLSIPSALSQLFSLTNILGLFFVAAVIGAIYLYFEVQKKHKQQSAADKKKREEQAAAKKKKEEEEKKRYQQQEQQRKKQEQEAKRKAEKAKLSDSDDASSEETDNEDQSDNDDEEEDSSEERRPPPKTSSLPSFAGFPRLNDAVIEASKYSLIFAVSLNPSTQLETLKARYAVIALVHESFLNDPISFGWVNAAQNASFTDFISAAAESVDLGGMPKAVVMHKNRKKFAFYDGPFEKKALKKWVQRLLEGEIKFAYVQSPFPAIR